MTDPTTVGPRRTNKVRQRLDAGETAVILAGHSVTADTADFVGQFGADGFWVEGEHGSATWDRLADIARACEVWNVGAMYRVRTLDPSLIRGRSASACTASWCRNCKPPTRPERWSTPPVSPRTATAACRGRRSYANPSFLDDEADSVVTVVQLEDAVALANIEEIVEVPGIDVVFVAPNDLAQALGHQGHLDHPEVVAAWDDTLTRIAASGKVAAGTLCPADQIDRFVGLGVRFLYTTYDPWIAAGARSFLSQIPGHGS